MGGLTGRNQQSVCHSTRSVWAPFATGAPRTAWAWTGFDWIRNSLDVENGHRCSWPAWQHSYALNQPRRAVGFFSPPLGMVFFDQRPSACIPPGTPH